LGKINRDAQDSTPQDLEWQNPINSASGRET
jgi:hypothetical protein